MKEKLISRIAEHGLQRFALLLMKDARESVRLVPVAGHPGRPGGTRLGGLPDLPWDLAWPTFGGHPLSLIAQVNLAELQVASPVELLPSDGMLWFFYDNRAWGSDPRNRGSGRVIYGSWVEEDLVEREPPGPLQVYQACGLDFDRDLTLPASPKLGQKLSDDEEMRVWRLVVETGRGHHLLGHALPFQGEMELQCELVSRGLDNDPTAYEPLRTELEAGAKDWRLLLQVASEEKHSDMLWGDGGCLYFWIRRQDLLCRHFDDVWLIMQCS